MINGTSLNDLTLIVINGVNDFETWDYKAHYGVHFEEIKVVGQLQNRLWHDRWFSIIVTCDMTKRERDSNDDLLFNYSNLLFKFTGFSYFWVEQFSPILTRFEIIMNLFRTFTILKHSCCDFNCSIPHTNITKRELTILFTKISKLAMYVCQLCLSSSWPTSSRRVA